MKYTIRDGDRGKTLFVVDRFGDFLANLQYYLLKHLDGDDLTVTISTGSRRTDK